MRKTVLHFKSFLLIAFFSPLVFIVSCEEDEISGACERRTNDSGTYQYMCFNEVPEGSCTPDAGDLATFHPDKSCAELGYSNKIQGMYSASPSHFGTPGSNGNWGSNNNSGGGSSGSTGTYSYTFTCSQTNKSYTVEIPIGNCETHYKYYAKVFGCNEIDNMYTACNNLHTCAGFDVSICDSYK